MRLIISQAKKMKVDTDSFPCHRLPAFLPQNPGNFGASAEAVGTGTEIPLEVQ